MVYSENHFDVVMAHCVLHLAEDKEEANKKIFRLTKPGKNFTSSTASTEDFLGCLSNNILLIVRNRFLLEIHLTCNLATNTFIFFIEFHPVK